MNIYYEKYYDWFHKISKSELQINKCTRVRIKDGSIK